MITKIQIMPQTQSRRPLRANTSPMTRQNLTCDTVEFRGGLKAVREPRKLLTSEFVGLGQNSLSAYIFTTFNAARGRVVAQKSDVTELRKLAARHDNMPSCARETANLLQDIIDGRKIAITRESKSLVPQEIESLSKLEPMQNLDVIQNIFVGLAQDTIDPQIAHNQLSEAYKVNPSQSLQAVGVHLEKILY